MSKQINYFSQLQKLLPKAVAPFSHFHVAAIIKSDRGLFYGVNVEHYIMTLSTCAERNAWCNALTNGAKTIDEIHLMTSDQLGQVNMCGACREFLFQWTHPKTKVFVYNHQGQAKTFSMGQLLPDKVDKLISDHIFKTK